MLSDIELKYGIIKYNPIFFDTKLATYLFDHLKDSVEWKQEKGQYRPFPRLTAYFADEGVKYIYSGVTHESLPWIDHLSVLRNKINDITGIKFNSLLLNYYRDGNDSIGFHSDSEKELGDDPIVPSISLGATRTFMIKSKTTKEKMSFELPNGSLLIMMEGIQKNYLHGVPKSKEEVGGRINLTFRKIC